MSLSQAKDQSLTMVCKLLGIEESQLRMWLCNRKIETVGETLTKPLTESQVGLCVCACECGWVFVGVWVCVCVCVSVCVREKKSVCG